MEILRRLAEGNDNGAIARELKISEKTVVNRLSTIYQKLHVNNRTQAALYALRKGWANVKINL
jgi:DNA-binding NarL/FixJ family response regulator